MRSTKFQVFFAAVFGLFASSFVRADSIAPTDNLLAAIANASDGAVLELSAGTYEISDEIVLDKVITLVGAGIDQTIIKQTATDKHVAVLDHANAKIEGCTLTGANFPSEMKDGIGVKIAAGGGTLEACRITGNRTNRNWNYVVGVYCMSADGHLIDCIIDDNRVTAGTNMSEGGLYITAGTVEHCLIYNNKGHQTGGIYVCGGNVTISRCTIAGNDATSSNVGAVNLNASGATFTDCVIAGNVKKATDTSTSAPEYSMNATGAWATFNNCAFPNSITLNSANIKGTPFQCDVLYVDPANHDYHQRIISGAKDIGYFAPFDYNTFGCDFTLSADSLFTGETVSFTAAINGVAVGETVSCAWTVTQPDNTTVALTGDTVDFQPTQLGRHSVKLVVTKAGAAPVEYIQTDCFVAASRETHVTTAAELQAAVDIAKDGSVIICAPGIYELNGQVELGKGIRLIGAGPDKTTLRQTALKNRVVKLNHPNDWVEGFTLTGGNSGGNKGTGVEYYNGMGVYIGVGGTVTNCHIIGNTNSENWNHGMGVYMLNDGLITHCVITNNTRLNGVNQYGGGVYLKNGTIDNCLVAFNSINNSGGGIYAEGSAKIRNCTICGNKVVAGTGGGIYWQNQSAQAQCINTIVAGNASKADDTTAGRPEWASNTSKAMVQSTCFPSDVGVTGLSGTPLLIDPIFVDAAAGDYRVMPSSLTRDAGTDYEVMPEGDLDGNPRKSGETAVDLGCYEYDATQFGAAFEGPADPRGFKDVVVMYTASVTGVDESLVTFNWTITSPSGDVTTATGKTYSFAAGAYGIWTISMTATANGQTSEPYAATYSVCPPELYVVEATAENMAKAEAPFDSWNNASTNLLELMRVWALPGCTIHLGEGTIFVDRRVDLSDDMKLIGQGWQATTLQQTAKTTSILYLNHEKAVVSGMTLTGFHATAEIHSRGAVIIDALGGTVEDCRITGNKYNDGINQACGIGITLNGEKAVCRRCIIDRNKGSTGVNNDRGGGVQGIKGLLENCLVCLNTNKYAAGISIGSDAAAADFTVRNCTVYGNVAVGTDSGYGQYGVGGIGQHNGRATIENTIIFGNTSPNQTWEAGGYPEWRTNGGTLTFVNCLLPADIGWPANATDCLNGDPLFKNVAADNFHLTAESPAINVGALLDYTEDSVDLEGNPRIFDFGSRRARPDLGCYESVYGIHGLKLILR